MIEMCRPNKKPSSINDDPSARTISVCTVGREHVSNDGHQEFVRSRVIEIGRQLYWRQPMATTKPVVPSKLESAKEWRHGSRVYVSDQATANGKRR